MKKITVVIPFLNEGIELYNTVKSIRESSYNDNVDIILIDDCSYDGYDYKKVSKIFDTSYFRHDKRIGIAESRNEGIHLSNTECFILLDAHMRIFQNDWVSIIYDSITKNDKSIICCQTIPLNNEGIPINNFNLKYGAFIDFLDLSVKWNKIDFYPHQNESIIPCVLGASYASSKSYWNYIKGTKGLKYYGYDEQLISLKSWLAGGNCILAKDITFGHIYRTISEMPYTRTDWDFMYNKYYISKLFFNSKIFDASESLDEKKLAQKKIYNEINKNINMINSQLLWYKKIFTRNISEIIDIHNDYKNKNRSLF